MRPSRDDMLARIAEVVAMRSTCSRAHVGAVISRDGRIISTGYNGAAKGMPHCVHDANVDPWRGCDVAVHAEANAIAFAARHGTATEGAVMHTTHAPCLACAKLIVNAGISGVWSTHPYRLTEGVDLLTAVGVRYNPQHDERRA